MASWEIQVLEFAKRPIDDRLVYFDEVASRRRLGRLIVEKDFWVCFTLRLLFETPGLSDKFVFKGGTSLSKIFNIIKRFSEDVDLSIDPNWLGFDGDKSPDKAPSRTQFNKRCKELNKACITAVEKRVQPILEQAISEILGSPDSSKTHLSFDFDKVTKSPVLIFHYPTKESDERGYIHPRVKLELGSLTDQAPTGSHTATSWVAEEFPAEFNAPKFHVVSLEAERTFWEKATILHAEYHKPQEKPMRNHLSRDIYDLCCMASHKSGQRALADVELLERVVTYKKTYFHSNWANYDAAKPGTLCLMPPNYRFSELKTDYGQMQEMFYETPPDFDDLLEKLRTIEEKLNSS
jgi:hypothetical protein